MKRDGNLERVSFGSRIIALLWDYVIILGYLFLLFGVSFLERPLLIQLFTSSPLSAEITGFILITLPVYLYFALCEGSKSHATWGKRIMGIEVAGVHGQPIGLRSSFFRSALKLLPWELAHFTIWHIVTPTEYPEFIIYLLFAIVYGLVIGNLISALLSKNKQTLYDIVAGTVIRYNTF